MKFKKLLSGILAAAMAVTSLTGALTVSAADYDFLSFEYSETLSGYSVKLTGDYTSKMSSGDLVIPESYNDEIHGEAQIVSADNLGISSTGKDNFITSITYPKGVSTAQKIMQFKGFKSLKTVKWLNPNTLILGANLFRDSSVQEVYIYATDVTLQDSSFRTINESAKIYVASESVKNQIVNATASGSYPVSADKIEVMESSLPTPVVTLTCEDIDFGTEGGFKPTAKVTVSYPPLEAVYSCETDENGHLTATRHSISF